MHIHLCKFHLPISMHHRSAHVKWNNVIQNLVSSYGIKYIMHAYSCTLYSVSKSMTNLCCSNCGPPKPKIHCFCVYHKLVMLLNKLNQEWYERCQKTKIAIILLKWWLFNGYCMLISDNSFCVNQYCIRCISADSIALYWQ